MGCKSCFGQIIKLCDLFALTQFFRYKQDEDYKTFSGGVLSILVIIIFLILFSDNAINTVNKTDIEWSTVSENIFEPTSTQIKFNPSTKTMFAIGILGLNLNDPSVKYFDIELIPKVLTNESFFELQKVELVPCTIEHFSVTQQIKNNFETARINNRVCPPLNFQFNISGKWSSSSTRFLEIRISKCTNSSNSTQICANQSVIDNFIAARGQVNALLYYINPLINPGSPDYIDYYIDDRNFISFTMQQGAYSLSSVQDFTIQTDQSLLPYTSNHFDHGLRIPETFTVIPYSTLGGSKYGSFFITKSGEKTTFKRSFNKIDQFFSYVGGLIGTILGLMLFMNNFSLMAFQLDIGQHYFQYKDDDEKTSFSSFNIFSYFAYLLYKLGSICGFCKNWNQMEKKVKYKQQMEKQLDVKLLLLRFSFLERAVESLLKKKKIPEDQFFSMQSLSTIKKRRRKYRKVKPKHHENESSQSSESEDSSSEKEECFQNNVNLNNSQQHLNSFGAEKKNKIRKNISNNSLQNEKGTSQIFFQGAKEQNDNNISFDERKYNQILVKDNKNIKNEEPSNEGASEMLHFESIPPFE